MKLLRQITSCTSAALVIGLCVISCGGSMDAVESDAESETTAEATLELSTVNVACTESGTWPNKTLTFCGDHAHTPYQWHTSYSNPGTAQCTSKSSIATETCGVCATVAVDSYGHTSPTKCCNVIDTRTAFSILPSEYTVPVNTSVTLQAPAIHANRHCDGQGSFHWEVYNEDLARWIEVPGTDNVANWSAWNDQVGDEVYRLHCEHPRGAHDSTAITINWVAASPSLTCSLVCSEVTAPEYACTGLATGGTSPYTYQWKYGNNPWYPGDATKHFNCKSSTMIYFKARDSQGTECTKTRLCGPDRD